MPSGTDVFDSSPIKGSRRALRIIGRTLAGLAVVFLVFALYVYGSSRFFRIEISNRSADTLTNVRVTMPARYPLPDWTVWSGTLKPGESHVLYSSTAGEGSLTVMFGAGGQFFEGGDYVTDWLAENEYFNIQPGGKIQVRSDDRYRAFWLVCSITATDTRYC